MDALQLRELLARKRRAEVRIALADDANHLHPKCRRIGPVARLPAAARHQCSRAVLPKYLAQPKHLATAKPHQRHCLRNPDPLLCQIAQNVHPIDLRTAHQNHRHRPPAPHPIRKPGRVTSLSGVYTRGSRNGIYGTSGDHSGLMPANLITFAHFSVSLAMRFLKAAGDSTRGVAPNPAMRAFILGSTRATLISLLSVSRMSTGVFLGAPMPNHTLTSKPGTDSPTVGMSGNSSKRFALVTASARNLPLLTCSSDTNDAKNAICTCPPSRSVIAGPAPRYGM